jgi:hypothetical protein
MIDELAARIRLKLAGLNLQQDAAFYAMEIAPDRLEWEKAVLVADCIQIEKDRLREIIKRAELLARDLADSAGRSRRPVRRRRGQRPSDRF